MDTKIAFHFILADNDVDAEGEAFTNGALEEICGLCIGHYGLFDGTEVKAKITNATIMDSCGATKDGRQKCFIYAEAEFPNNECGRKFIGKILLEKPIASIACSALNMDKVADGVTMISNVTNFYEFSLRFDEEKETMDKKSIERRLEAAEKQMIGLQDEIQNLKAQLAEMQDEPEIPDFPEFYRGSDYWYVDDNFTLQKSQHSGYVGEKGIKGDEILYNAFHTEKYAQEFAKKCKLIAMMLHCKWYLCRDFKGDYSSSNDKWVVYYGGLDNKFIATNSIHCDYGFVPFDTMENAQKCAEWLNEHWKEDGND